MTLISDQAGGLGWWDGRVTYCSFKSVNCFSRVVISSRHSILLLSQSSSSISVHMKTWHVWRPSPSHWMRLSCTNVTLTVALYYIVFPRSKYQHIVSHSRMSCWKTHVFSSSCLRPIIPTRAVSIFRHRRANGVILVCAAAVLLVKIHLHLVVVTFLLLPGVNRHCPAQTRRGWWAGGPVRYLNPRREANVAQMANRVS